MAHRITQAEANAVAAAFHSHFWHSVEKAPSQYVESYWYDVDDADERSIPNREHWDDEDEVIDTETPSLFEMEVAA